jgi:DNA repair protein RecO
VRTLSDQALLLEVSNLQERDRVVELLTRHHGRKRGAAPGARRRYSRFAGQLQPLALVHVTWFERADRDLVRIRDVELVRSSHRLQEDLEGILLTCYLAEQVKVFAPEGEADEVLFRLLDTTLLALLAGVDRDLAARYFEIWMLRRSGIFPAPRECPGCEGELAGESAVLPRGGEALLCRRCAPPGGLVVDAEAVDLLLRSGREALAGLAAAPPSVATLRRVEQLCGEVRRRFLQHELRSYEVMQRTLAGGTP